VLRVKRSTGDTHTHATAEQTTRTNTERATVLRVNPNVYVYMYICIFPLHTAFADPSSVEGSPDRESIEVRCVVMF